MFFETVKKMSGLLSQLDMSQTQEQNPGQRNPTQKDLEEQRKEMISHLQVRNNREDGDEGIRMVIETFDTDNPERALNVLLKDQLLAALGFMHYLSFEAAKERFKGINKPELITKITEKYRLISPDLFK